MRSDRDRGVFRRPARHGSTAARPSKGALRVALLVGALALAVHLPALWNGFVYDDHYEIETNPVLRQPFSIRLLLLTEYWGSGSQTGWYRPVPLIFQKVIFDFAGTDPLPYHALVLGSHVLLSALLAGFIAFRFGLTRGALLAGALFAVHTVHTEAVSTAYGLKEVLAGLFSFLALLALTGWRQEAPWGRLLRLGAAGLCLALAILSKESAAPVGAGLLAADLLRGAPFRRWVDAIRANGRAALLHGAYFASVTFAAVSMRFPAVGAILARTEFDPVTNPIAGLEQPWRLAMGLRLAWHYGLLLVWPIPFTPSYAVGSIPVPESLVAPDLLGGALLLISLAAAAALAPRLRPPAGMGAIWTIASYLLASNLLLAFSTLMSERFLYLPSLGLALLLAPTADRLLAPWRPAPGGTSPAGSPAALLARARIAPLAAAAAAAVVALGVLTFTRTPVYGDDARLMRAAHRWYPRSSLARLAHARELSGQGLFEEAEAELMRLKEEYPDLPRVDEHLAANAQGRGDDEAALRHWDDAARHRAADAGIHLAYAELLVQRGETDRAVQQLSDGIRKGGGVYASLARARELRGVLLMRKGRLVQGLADLRLATLIDPEQPAIWLDYGQALEEVGDLEGAARAFHRALDLSPSRIDVLGRLARHYLLRRQGSAAIPLLERAVSLEPENLRLRSDLGTACVQAGEMEMARTAFEEILARDARHGIALATLGSIEEREGRRERALSLYERFMASHPAEGPLARDVRARWERLTRDPGREADSRKAPASTPR